MTRPASKSCAAIIVAAGRGTRAGGEIAKQWQELGSKTVADWTLDAFRDHPAITQIILVHHADDAERAKNLLRPGEIAVAGGADRAASVRAGLAVAQADIVLIHDVARPCVPQRVITDVITALDDGVAAAPALAVTDALWTGADGRVTGVQDRTGLYRAQTPQGFHTAAIRAAHNAHPGGAADDVEVARAAGLDVTIVPGDEDNLKITLPADFDRAARILETRP